MIFLTVACKIISSVVIFFWGGRRTKAPTTDVLTMKSIIHVRKTGHAVLLNKFTPLRVALHESIKQKSLTTDVIVALAQLHNVY